MASDYTTDHQFKDWSNRFTCRPSRYYEPTTVQEIQQILNEARENREHVKVVGKCHSMSRLCYTSGYMICLATNMNHILNIDRELLQVEVEAGMYLKDLNEALWQNNMSLPYLLLTTDDVSVGGIMAVSGHSSGRDMKTVPNQVVSLKLVTPSGELVEYSKTKHPDIFEAARCNLGVLGVVVSFVLQCVPKFNVEVTTQGVPVEEAYKELESNISGSERFEMYIYPHTGGAVVLKANKTDKAETDIPRPPGIMNTIIETMYWIGKRFPSFITKCNNFIYSLASKKQTYVMRNHTIAMSVEFNPRLMQYAFTPDNAQKVLREIDAWFEKTGYKAHLPIMVWCSDEDEVLLSMANGRTRTVIVAIVTYTIHDTLPDCDEYFVMFDNLATKYAGRPHWAGPQVHDTGAFYNRKRQEELYGESFKKFCEVREKLDPDDMFLNDHTRPAFKYPSSSSTSAQ